MSDLQVTNVFADGDTVNATNFNTNYSDIVTYINNRNSGSSTWDAFYMTSASNVPTFNNSTGTQSIVQMNDNGTSAFEIVDGGYIHLPLQDYSKSCFNRLPTGATIAAGATANLTAGGQATVLTQTHSSMDVTTGRFTAAVGGKYFVSGRLRLQIIAGSVSGTLTMTLKKNGAAYSSLVIDSAAGALGSLYPFIIDVVSLSIGDYLEMDLTSNASATLNAVDTPSSESENTRMFVFKLA